MGEDGRLVRTVDKGDGGIEALLAVHAVIHRADLHHIKNNNSNHLNGWMDGWMGYLETLLGTAQETRLSAPITTALLTNHCSLHEDTATAVIAFREGDTVLVILSEMEVTREPSFDAGVLAHNINKAASRLATRVVQPAAAIDDVVLLQDT